MKWSISAHNLFQRCQRQYLFNTIIASANSLEEIRKEAYILKQLQGWIAWQGSIVHEGIHLFVIPQLKPGRKLDVEDVIDSTLKMARRQYIFSQNKRYRHLTREIAGTPYAALFEHEYNYEIDTASLQQIPQNIRTCFLNLFEQQDLLEEISGHRGLYCEKFLQFPVGEDITIWSKLDLIFFRSDGHLVIIDWKVANDVTSDYSRQVMVYALAAKHRWPRTAIENFVVKEVNLLKNTIKTHLVTDKSLMEIEDFIYRSSTNIQNLAGNHDWDAQCLEDFEPANSCRTCQYCKFKKICQEVYS